MLPTIGTAHSARSARQSGTQQVDITRLSLYMRSSNTDQQICGDWRDNLMTEKRLKILQDLPLACPLDGLPLVISPHGLSCEQNHNFDIARHGYVNLLPVHHKSSKDPGDSKAMVNARRDVLDCELFSPLAQAVSDLVCSHVQSRPAGDFLVVDAGCGEGYYTAHFANHLIETMPNLNLKVLGIDISKWAVMAAAKRYETIGWAVANNNRLPVCKGSADMITCLFGFKTWQSWAEIQKSGQKTIVVDAGPAHLLELREIIYDKVKLHDAPTDTDALSAGYEKLTESNVCFEKEIVSPKTIENILTMTPHGHKISRDRFQKALEIDHMNLTFDATVRVYGRI